MRILITSGGTREYIDPVRFISNASSGRMGYALARAALKAGHKVTLISASDLQPPVGVDFVGVESAKDMFNAVKKFFPKCDCLIMAAAVADYTPARPAPLEIRQMRKILKDAIFLTGPAKTKIKRTDKPLTIRLKPTPDILKWAAANKKSEIGNRKSKMRRRRRLVVGFALEDKNLRKNAEKKLKEKNLDMIIANTPTAIGADRSTVQIKTPDSSWTKIENASKITIAKRIIRIIERLSQ